MEGGQCLRCQMIRSALSLLAVQVYKWLVNVVFEWLCAQTKKIFLPPLPTLPLPLCSCCRSKWTSLVEHWDLTQVWFIRSSLFQLSQSTAPLSHSFCLSISLAHTHTHAQKHAHTHARTHVCMVLIEYASTPGRHIMPIYLKASCTSEICPQLHLCFLSEHSVAELLAYFSSPSGGYFAA